MKIIENIVEGNLKIHRILVLIIFLIEEEMEIVIILIKKILMEILMEVRAKMKILRLI